MTFEAASLPKDSREISEDYRRAMIRVVEDLFVVMLGASIRCCSAEAVPREEAITSLVNFKGADTGALWLRCSVRQARSIAALFMGGMETNREEELLDVMRELANIIGGNIRRSLPAGVSLGNPSVNLDRTADTNDRGFPEVVRTCFEWNGEAFSLNLGRGLGGSQCS